MNSGKGGETERREKGGKTKRNEGARRNEKREKKKKENVRWDRERGMGGKHCLPIKIRKKLEAMAIGLLSPGNDIGKLGGALTHPLPFSCLFYYFQVASRWLASASKGSLNFIPVVSRH